ncbi:trehalose 6-phosphate phosphatase [Halopolyspora algeriensis]|uniref:Trehalose 6-phosphate phosphatase n=1 Tax=Halopolyspora algeriensis TaxID=1500506 RepID=A0A368VX90_9ACTN|nr:glycosyl hydrolase family 65 protein [Halopolyspora algeriensis]RCW45927.1 trehalose 6-phosphate phosphatase [Halopolyspora algeriensis]TQM55340.1 trehalose 6-phosphate phosphatase [Halopolyspora algeriensis]
MTTEPRNLRFDDFVPGDEGRREALCTLGNGYFATRGAAPESRADDVHYPGTYVAGCYNRLTACVAGREVENESLVNMPNWLPLTFRAEDAEWFDLTNVTIVGYQQELDLKRGVLLREIRFRDGAGRTTRLTQRRFVSMDSPHVAGLETTLHPENWSGNITFRAGLDGGVTNSGVVRYSALGGQHLTDHVTREDAPDVILLHAQTSQSRIRVAQAARTRMWLNESPATPERAVHRREATIAHDITTRVERGEEVRVEKIVSLYTSRDVAITEPAAEAVDSAHNSPAFGELLEDHTRAWDRLRSRFHFSPSTSEPTQQAIRLHSFHLLQTISEHTVDIDAGVPARGLHGEAYRGHVFWDELFVLPTITLRLPRVARAMLLYRYRRLARARESARACGHRGAMFPWQSGSNGREESQRIHLNPRSGRWIPDATHLQRHIGTAIAHNVWHYCEVSGDGDFLENYGAEIILDVARFFSSIAQYDPIRERYVVRHVVGPDEYHTGYPGREQLGIDNNAYTNVMTAWLCSTAVRTLAALSPQRRAELITALDIRDEEIDRWKHLSRRMFVPFHEGSIISQFEGYEQLAELDWEEHRTRYGDVQRLDRILESAGDDPNRYKISKQADVLMLFYLFSAEELGEILGGLGYMLTPEVIPDNIDYYLRRTSHGSTLSAVVHSWVLARAHRERAVDFFERTLASDLNNTQHGTTPEGIHLAAMVGSMDLLQRCFAGIEPRGGVLHINPFWPTELGTLELTIRYRQQPVTIRIDDHSVTVSALPALQDRTVLIRCGRRSARLASGATATFPLDNGRPRP